MASNVTVRQQSELPWKAMSRALSAVKLGVYRKCESKLTFVCVTQSGFKKIHLGTMFRS